MVRDTQAVKALQELTLDHAGRPAPTGVVRERLENALAGLASDDDLTSAMQEYLAALAAAAGTSVAGVRTLLADLTTSPIAFLGPLHDEIRLVVERATGLGVDLDSAVDLGPVGVTVSAPAVTVRPDPAQPSDRARATLGHLPISGLSTRLDLGPVRASGAGYVDTAGKHAGAVLRADLGPARVDVALLLDARDGLAVLALLRAEFRPTGIQLGLGFSLDAVGGIVGVNRSVDGEAMRDRIADGSALDALFGGGGGPGRIRSTLDALGDVFPPRSGSHVVGPTLRLGWLTVMGGSLARLDVGVVLVIPSGRVLLPGRIVVEVPGPGFPLLHLRLDVLGEVDLAGRRLALDAALVDSTVLGALTVTGTAAVRLFWGDPAVVLATVGGCYPGFRVAPAVFPPQRRIGITLTSPVPVGLRLSLEGYVAAAAGTLQTGASVSIAFEVLGTGISGSAGFDAIVQLLPLWFEAAVSGKVALRAFGQELVSVTLRGHLTGPGPLVLTARATGRIIVKVGGTKSFTLSGSPGADRRPFDGLVGVVQRHLESPANVGGEGGPDPEVRLAPLPGAGAPLLAPDGALVWAQDAFPLDGPFTKADGRVLRHPSAVRVTHRDQAPPAVRRMLTTAAFNAVTTADALTGRAFDEREVGWRLTPVTTRSQVEESAVTDHRTVFLPVTDKEDRRWMTAAGQAVPYAVGVAVRALDRPAAVAPDVAPEVAVASETWTVTTPAGVPSRHASGAAAHAHASVVNGARPLPEMAGAAVVLP